MTKPWANQFVPNIPFQEIPKKKIKTVKPTFTGFESNSTQEGFEVPKPVIFPDSILTNGVIAESYESGIEHLFSFVNRRDYNGYNYALLIKEEDGSFRSYERISQPCWGSLRTYGNKSTRPDDPKPGDLISDDRQFPATGKVEALGVAWIGHTSYISSNSKENFNRFYSEFVFNKDVSPWSCLLKDVELVIKDDLFIGCVFKDCHIDPTVLAQFLRAFAAFYHSTPNKWCNIMDSNPGIDPKVAFLSSINTQYNSIHGMSKRVVFERFFNSNPFDLSNGGTLHDREDYNRPDRDYVFGGKGNVGESITGMSLQTLIEKHAEVMNKDKEDVSNKVA